MEMWGCFWIKVSISSAQSWRKISYSLRDPLKSTVKFQNKPI